jgi:predicted ATPase
LLASIYDRTGIYRDWSLGRGSPLRLPQQADLRGDFLAEDASNLSLVIHSLLNKIGGKELLLKYLGEFCLEFEDMGTDLVGGTMQVFLREAGLSSETPVARLSDGTLRYLCLLAILCHPDLPPVVCIEEPELGLHPDILPTLARLLVEASERAQIIVTTHSDLLVSALTEVPESVLVCQRTRDGSHLRRLGGDRLRKWLADYSLGELWLTGRLGGTL